MDILNSIPINPNSLHHLYLPVQLGIIRLKFGEASESLQNFKNKMFFQFIILMKEKTAIIFNNGWKHKWCFVNSELVRKFQYNALCFLTIKKIIFF